MEMSEIAKPDECRSLTMKNDDIRPNWAVLAAVRFVLASIVVVAHLCIFWEHPLFDEIEKLDALAAVIGFFMISGFSIHHSIQRDAQLFYQRRFRRIYPIYLVCLLFAVLCHFLPYVHGAPIGNFDYLLLAISTLIFAQSFVTPVPYNFMPSWTIGIEVALYALAPLFFKMRARWIWGLIVVSAGLFAWNPLELVHGSHPVFVFSLVWAWLIGWMAAHEQMQSPSRRKMLFAMLFILPCMCLVLNGESVGVLRWIPILLVALALTFSHKIAISKLTKRCFIWAGDCSYPLYLIHIPVMIFMIKIGITSPIWSLLMMTLLSSLLVVWDKRLTLAFLTATKPKSTRGEKAD